MKQRDQETKLIDRVGDTVVYMQYPNSVAVRIKDIESGTYDAFGLGAKDKRSLMRPVDSEVIDNERIAIASTPNYGKYTGTVTIYNAKKHEVEKHYWSDGLIPASLAYDGKYYLYVGTSVRGEHADLASRPEKTASVLKINMRTGEIIKKQPFDEETLNISAIDFDDKGRLFAYSLDTLLELNPKDLSVVRKHDFGGYKGNNYTDDLIYSSKHEGFIAAMNGKIYWIDPDDITVREELDEGSKVTIADSGNIYYNKSNRVIRAVPYVQEIKDTEKPSEPTNEPTEEPSVEPSDEPTDEPTKENTDPSDYSTEEPSEENTEPSEDSANKPMEDKTPDHSIEKEKDIVENNELNMSEEPSRKQQDGSPSVNENEKKENSSITGSSEKDILNNDDELVAFQFENQPENNSTVDQNGSHTVHSNNKISMTPSANYDYQPIGEQYDTQKVVVHADKQFVPPIVDPATHTGGQIETSFWDKLIRLFR